MKRLAQVRLTVDWIPACAGKTVMTPPQLNSSNAGENEGRCRQRVLASPGT